MRFRSSWGFAAAGEMLPPCSAASVCIEEPRQHQFSVATREVILPVAAVNPALHAAIASLFTPLPEQELGGGGGMGVRRVRVSPRSILVPAP